MQAELVAAERSIWEPRCVAQTFCSSEEPFAFTMQAWINLDAVRSPFLLGELPEAEVALVQFKEAFAAFGHWGTTPEACEPEELVLIGRKIIGEIAQGFSMRVKLAPPEGCKLEEAANNGIGYWLPIVTCLKSQLGFSLAEALELPVGKAFALIAAHRCNGGWSVAGENYAQRDIEDVGSVSAEVGSSEQIQTSNASSSLPTSNLQPPTSL